MTIWKSATMPTRPSTLTTEVAALTPANWLKARQSAAKAKAA
jgi:hypothetical protein